MEFSFTRTYEIKSGDPLLNELSLPLKKKENQEAEEVMSALLVKLMNVPETMEIEIEIADVNYLLNF